MSVEYGPECDFRDWFIARFQGVVEIERNDGDSMGNNEFDAIVHRVLNWNDLIAERDELRNKVQHLLSKMPVGGVLSLGKATEVLFENDNSSAIHDAQLALLMWPITTAHIERLKEMVRNGEILKVQLSNVEAKG